MALTNFLVGIFAPGVIISGLKKQDPEKLGQHCADLVDELLDKEFKGKKSEQIQAVIVPFLDKFVKSFNARLLEDSQKERK